LKEDGTPKLALQRFAQCTPQIGICQWFDVNDARLDDAVMRLKNLGVTYLRTGLSWADSLKPNGMAWFDRKMKALEDFKVTVTYCFTPEDHGVTPHYTSPPKDVGQFADFCVRMTRRYAS
jgi:beta-xylosidase